MTKETAEYDLPSGTGGISLSMGELEGDVIRTTPGGMDMDTDDIPEEEDTEGASGDDEGTADVDGEVDADDDADADGDAEADAEDLGDFDAEDADVVAKFDQRYTLEDGSLDADGALSAEYFANVEKGIDGLNEATYDYLATKGITKATVKQIEAMAATNRDAQASSVQAHDLKLFELAGGPDELAAALAWGKGGGYSQAQIDRFNKTSKGKSLEAKEEAVEVLMARYRRSDAYKESQAAAKEAARPKLPRRDATKNQGGSQGGVKPYASRQEMRQARDSLRDNDTKGWAEHNRRLLASKFD